MSTKFITRRPALWKYIGIALIFGCSIMSRADSAQEILNRGLALQDNGTYTATLMNNSGKIYQKANVDGTVCHRIEFAGKGTPITLKNSSGSFMLYPDSKIAVREADTDREKPNFDAYATYTMSEEEYNGKPCYIIIREIPITNKTLTIFKAFTPEEQRKQPLSEIRKIFKEYFATKAVFRITKDDNLIYAIANYNSNGKFLSEVKYSKIEINPSLSDELFEIPNGYTIKRTISVLDFAETTGQVGSREAEQKLAQRKLQNQPGFWSQIPHVLNIFFIWLWDGLLAYGGWIFLIIGIGTIAIILILKWKERERRY